MKATALRKPRGALASLLFAVLAAACDRAGDADAAAISASNASSPAPLVWGPCNVNGEAPDAQCTTLIVPWDENDASRGTFPLAVVRKQTGAKGCSAGDYVFVDTGGPSNHVPKIASSLGEEIKKFVAGHDVVAMSRRGLGGTEVVCDGALTYERVLTNDVLDDAQWPQISRRLTQELASCAPTGTSPAYLAYLSPRHAVGDVLRIEQALRAAYPNKPKGLKFFGISHGGTAGSWLVQRRRENPETVTLAAMALDSPADTYEKWTEPLKLLARRTQKLEASLTTLLQTCSARSAASGPQTTSASSVDYVQAFRNHGATPPAGARRFSNLLYQAATVAARYPDGTLVGTKESDLTPADLCEAVAPGGTATSAAQRQKAQQLWETPSSDPSSLRRFAIGCLDGFGGVSEAEFRAAARTFARDYPLLQGALLVQYVLPCLFAPLPPWARGNETFEPTTATPPFLVTSSRRDLVVPSEESEALSTRLGASFTLYENEPHYLKGRAVSAQVSAYFHGQ